MNATDKSHRKTYYFDSGLHFLTVLNHVASITQNVADAAQFEDPEKLSQGLRDAQQLVSTLSEAWHQMKRKHKVMNVADVADAKLRMARDTIRDIDVKGPIGVHVVENLDGLIWQADLGEYHARGATVGLAVENLLSYMYAVVACRAKDDS